MPNGTPDSQENGLSRSALFRHPIHLRDGDSVWPANVRRFRQCDVIGNGKRFRYGAMAKRNGGALSGSVCACGLSSGDGHCRSTTPTLTNNRIIVNPSTNDPRTAIPFGRKAHALTRKCGQRRLRQAVTREGGHAKRNPRLARERAIGKRTLPSPHTLARRRFRLAGKRPAVPIMRCHRQGQAFSVWRGGQTEWRCGVR